MCGQSRGGSTHAHVRTRAHTQPEPRGAFSLHTVRTRAQRAVFEPPRARGPRPSRSERGGARQHARWCSGARAWSLQAGALWARVLSRTRACALSGLVCKMLLFPTTHTQPHRRRFSAMSEICCKTLLFPPLEWDFPVYSTNKIEAQRIRAFVANGNAMVRLTARLTTSLTTQWTCDNQQYRGAARPRLCGQGSAMVRLTVGLRV